MESYLSKIWGLIVSKMGPFGGFIVGIVSKIELDINDANVGKIQSRAVEMKEAAGVLDRFADKILAAVEDGTLTIEEGSDLALGMEKVLDEIEDIIKGRDEDD